MLVHDTVTWNQFNKMKQRLYQSPIFNRQERWPGLRVVLPDAKVMRQKLKSCGFGRMETAETARNCQTFGVKLLFINASFPDSDFKCKTMQGNSGSFWKTVILKLSMTYVYVIWSDLLKDIIKISYPYLLRVFFFFFFRLIRQPWGDQEPSWHAYVARHHRPTTVFLWPNLACKMSMLRIVKVGKHEWTPLSNRCGWTSETHPNILRVAKYELSTILGWNTQFW